MVINFQGFACSAVTYRRSIGLTPDASAVEVYVKNPSNINVRPGKAPVLPFGADQPNSLYEVGDLVVSTTVEGKEYSVTAKGLYVDSITRRNAASPGSPCVLTITMYDIRGKWDQGFLDRWRFNVLEESTETEEAQSAVSLAEIASIVINRLPGVTGIRRMPKEWSEERPRYEFGVMDRPISALRRILGDHRAVLILDADNKVAIYRENEEDDSFSPPPEILIEDIGGSGHQGGRSFTSYPKTSIVVGGDRIATVRIENWEPVLFVNGNPLSLSEALLLMNDRKEVVSAIGDETVSFVQQDIPSSEQLIPELQAALERNKERLEELELESSIVNATIVSLKAAGGSESAVERLQRRLRDILLEIESLEGGSERISEKLEDLQRQAFDPVARDIKAGELLARVRKFLVNSSTWKVLRGFTERDTDIIRRDAYRLFRLPKAEAENRELLPLLNRAERDGFGRRLPPLTRSYSITRRSSRQEGVAGGEGPLDAELDRLREQLILLRNTLYEGGVDKLRDEIAASFALKVANFIGISNPNSYTTGPFHNLSTKNEKIQELNPELVKQYEALRDEYYKTLQKKDPYSTEQEESEISKLLFEAGQELKDELIKYAGAESLQQFLKETAPPLTLEAFQAHYTKFYANALYPQSDVDIIPTYDGEYTEFMNELTGKLQKKYGNEIAKRIAQIRQKQADKRRVTQVGDPKGIKDEVYFFVNEGRTIDEKANIVDRDLGIIRTSRVSLQLEEDRISCAALPGTKSYAAGPGPDESWPVAVTFGVRIAPRFSPRPFTGDIVNQEDVPLEGSIIPPQVREALNSGNPKLGTYYSVWTTTGDGIVSKISEPLDHTDTRSTSAPDLVELIELTGASNVGALDLEAQRRSLGLLLQPTTIAKRRFSYIHPHDVLLNGAAAAVEISSRNNTLGFRTTIVEGISDQPFGPGKSVLPPKLDIMRMPKKLPDADNFDE